MSRRHPVPVRVARRPLGEQPAGCYGPADGRPPGAGGTWPATGEGHRDRPSLPRPGTASALPAHPGVGRGDAGGGCADGGIADARPPGTPLQPGPAVKPAGLAVPSAAAWLTAAGALPFLAGAALAWLAGPLPGELAVRAMIAYGAVILSFIGGIHWGFVTSAPGPLKGRWGLLSAATLPALLAWGALLLAPERGIAAVAAGLTAVLLLDRWAWVRGLAPRWWMRLRIPVTAVVVGALVAAAASPTVSTPRFTPAAALIEV
ncbi:MAG: DUF3429 domain-containing protein [Rhodospirillales bacterium]|nr:MAG: DUF3429 domain-containing protein [Rhodospirillales bacterium]